MNPTEKPTQSPFFLIFHLKSPSNMQALSRILPPLLPKMFEAADSIGTLHFARFVVLGDTTLAFVSEYDGTFDDYIMDFAKFLGPVFDAIFEHVNNPPPTPVAKNAESLLEWTKRNNLDPLAFYSAYPAMTVQDIKAHAVAA